MQNSQSENSTPANYTSLASSCFGILLLISSAIWIFMLSIGQPSIQFIVSGMVTTLPSQFYALFPIGQSILVILPMALLAILVKSPHQRSIYQVWLAAAIYALSMAPIHLPPFSAAQTRALLHILLSIIYMGLFILLLRKRLRIQADSLKPGSPSFPLITTLQALIIAALFAYPWLVQGALGSLMDTLLQGVSGLVLGLCTSLLLETLLFRPLRATSAGTLRAALLGSFSASVTLMLIISAIGLPFGGLQLIIIIPLALLGWIVGIFGTGYSSQRVSWLPNALLIGLAVAAPLVWIDADELFLLVSISSGELFGWCLSAGIASTVLSLVLALVAWGIIIVAKTLTHSTNGSARASQQSIAQLPIKLSFLPALLWGAALLLIWISGTAAYFLAGQPGLYGEGLFVILEDQADLTAAAQITDPLARRTYVYDTLVTHADSTQAELRQAFDRIGLEYSPYYLVNSIQVQAGPLVRLWLLTRPEVDRVLDNPWLRPLPVLPPVSSGNLSSSPGNDWNLTMIGADRVWEGFGVHGEGIIVGQSDSGVQGNHPEFAASYRGREMGDDYNWYDPWFHTTSPTDLGGHGTHTLGTILGQTTGVAPGATWYGCVNLARNLGNPALYLDCMQFMLAPFPQNGNPLHDGNPELGANVINNSWGCPEIEGCDAQSLLYGVRNLRLAGLFVVVSAGNDGPTCNSLKYPPAIYDEAFSVGAIDRYGDIAYFSSIGPVTVDGSGRVKPDIIAPGVDIFSTMPNNTYTANSGTSMAGPHLVGVVALMWSANPALIGDIETTEQIIIDTARPYTGALPNCPGASSMPSSVSGYGIVDAYEAVKAALELR